MTNVPERVARALCRLDGHPENATMDGKPLWQDYLPEARAAIEALREPDDVMLDAALRGDSEWADDGLRRAVYARAWNRMINAALGKGGE